jgi:hypothetical protein
VLKRIAVTIACAASISGASTPPPTLDDLLTCSAYSSFLEVARLRHADQVKTSVKDAKRQGYRIQEYACAVSEKRPFKWWNDETAEALVRLREEAGDWSNLGEMLAKYDALCAPVAETAEHYLSENKGAGCQFSMAEMMEGLGELR